MAPNTTQKTTYKITPIVEFGENTLIEFAKWRVCIKQPDKGRMLCAGLAPSEKMIVMVYWIETMIQELEEQMNFVHREIKEWYDAQDKIISKAVEPVVYDYPSLAERDMKWFAKEIETINRRIDSAINKYLKLKAEKDELLKAKGAILSVLRSRGFDVEQEVYLL